MGKEKGEKEAFTGKGKRDPKEILLSIVIKKKGKRSR